MINQSVSNFPAESASWSEVSRLCRRVCVLRENGEAVEAERLQNGLLAQVVAGLRTPSDTDDVIAARLEKIFSAEAERVANAAVLAELLAPMVAEQLRSLGETRLAHTPTATTANVGATDVPLKRPPEVNPAARGPGDIAGFIDEMIALERVADLESSGAHRGPR